MNATSSSITRITRYLRPVPLLLAAFIALILYSCMETPRVGQLLERYLWQKEVLLVFTPSVEDALYQQQLQALPKWQDKHRAIWQIIDEHAVIVDGEAKPQLSTAPFYEFFSLDPSHFTLVYLGKDGEIIRQSSAPVELPPAPKTE